MMSIQGDVMEGGGEEVAAYNRGSGKASQKDDI